MTPRIPNWDLMSAPDRAQAVIDWCRDNGIDTSSVNAAGLCAAKASLDESLITEQPDAGYADWSPMDYVHLIRGIAAFLAAG